MPKGLWFASGFLAAVALAAAWIFLLSPHARGPREAREMEPLARAEVQERSAQRFARLDADADGTITAAEWEAFHLGRFDAADTDKDGVLSKDEMRAARKAGKGLDDAS